MLLKWEKSLLSHFLLELQIHYFICSKQGFIICFHLSHAKYQWSFVANTITHYFKFALNLVRIGSSQTRIWIGSGWHHLCPDWINSGMNRFESFWVRIYIGSIRFRVSSHSVRVILWFRSNRANKLLSRFGFELVQVWVSDRDRFMLTLFWNCWAYPHVM